MSLNKVILAGRLTHEPELKHTTQGTPVIDFSLALNKGKGEAEFFECKAWRNTAEFICRYFRKGDGIGVDGQLASRSYEKNGEKRTIYYVDVKEVSFVEGKRSDSQGATAAPAPNLAQIANFGATDVQPNYVDMANDEDLPF